MYSFRVKKTMELSQFEVEYIMGPNFCCDDLDLSINEKEKKKTFLEVKKSYFFGVENGCGRGFELVVLEGDFQVLVNSPATLQDWEIAVNFLSKLSLRERSLIKDIEGNRYTSESILEFDYYLDIENALRDVYKTLCIDKRHEFLNILGMRYSQLINAELIQSFFDSEDLLVSFSDYMRESQWIDYEPTGQRIFEHKDTKEVLSFYYMVVNQPAVIPIRPIIEIAYDMQEVTHEMIDKYMIMFIDDDINVIGEVNHCHLEELLPKDKYRILDARNAAIEALSVEEIKDLARRSMEKDGEV